MASVDVNANEAADAENVATLDEMNGEALKTEDSEKEDSKCATVDRPGNERSEDAVAGNEESGDRKENGGERAFDHTNRKVIVQNVLKFLRNKEIEKLTRTWLGGLKDPNSIRIEKFKKPPTDSWVMLTFEHEDMVQPFLDHMSANNFTNRKGKPVFAVRADSRFEGRDDTKRKNEGVDEQDSKRRKTSSPKSKDEIRDVITPLWRLSYEQQIQTKQREMIKKCAIKIIQEVKGKFRNLEKEARRHKNREAVPMYDWVEGKCAIEVLQTIPSPKRTEYRNKCELNFGYRYEIDRSKTKGGDSNQGDANEEVNQVMRKIPSVGFMASGWLGGVSRPHILANIPSKASAIADIVEEFSKQVQYRLTIQKMQKLQRNRRQRRHNRRQARSMFLLFTFKNTADFPIRVRNTPSNMRLGRRQYKNSWTNAHSRSLKGLSFRLIWKEPRDFTLLLCCY